MRACEPEPRAASREPLSRARAHFCKPFLLTFLVHFVVQTFTNVFFPAVDRALAHLSLKTYFPSTIKTN